jgi:hypothetical protein
MDADVKKAADDESADGGGDEGEGRAHLAGDES